MGSRIAPDSNVGVPGRLRVLLAAATMVLAGCSAGPGASLPANPSAAQQVNPQPKTLRMGFLVEPAGVAGFGRVGQNPLPLAWFFNAGLTTYDAQGNLQPRLASKIPSIQDGDWKVLADGAMEVTWKLRPNLTWHDGTPLTAEDFVLGIQVATDAELPLPRSGGVSRIREATASDAETLVVRWSQSYFGANQGSVNDVPAVPRHLMQALYLQGDKQAFVNSPYWSTRFVGLGPYRLAEWVQGSYIEALAFDDYALGRPKIDRVIVRHILDARVLVASLLGGEIDMVGRGELTLEDLAPATSAWASTGAGTVDSSVSEVFWAILQYRDPALPWVGDVRVRQALLHLIDRQTLGDTFNPGGSGLPDLLAAPNDPAYQLAEQRGYAKYPYDPARAATLLTSAGWTRGSDGMVQSGAGLRFTLEVRTSADTTAQALAVADQWRRAGLDVPFLAIPDNAVDRTMQRAMSQGVYLQGQSIALDFPMAFSSAATRSEQNNWSGANTGGYSNPVHDRLYAQYASELDPAKRQSLYADFLKQAADEAIVLPLFYSTGQATTSFRRGIRGPAASAPIQRVTYWNIHEWEMD